MTFQLRNVGQTPATIKTIKQGIFPLSIEVPTPEIPHLLNDIDENRVVAISARTVSIAPNGTLKMSIATVHPLSANHAERLLIGNMKLVMLGVIYYLDAFKVGHKTTFLYSYNHVVGSIHTEMCHNEIA